MQRQTQIQTGTCTSCQELFELGQTHCSCGRPTPFASFEDRAAYEVAAWRRHLESAEQPA